MSASRRNVANVSSTMGKPMISRPSVSESVTPAIQTVKATLAASMPVSRYSASVAIRSRRAETPGTGAVAAAVAAMPSVWPLRGGGASTVGTRAPVGLALPEVDRPGERERGVRLAQPVVELHPRAHPVDGRLAILRRAQVHP